MPEQERAPLEQEALDTQLDQKIQAEPNLPEDRKGIFQFLNKNRATLGGLILAVGMGTFFAAPKETEARGMYAELGTKFANENDLIQTLKDADEYEPELEDTANAHGIQLNSLLEQRQKEPVGSAEYGKLGEAIIKHLVTMKSFCARRGVELEKIYDISKVDPQLMQAANKEFSKVTAISKAEKPQKPLAQGGFEKTRPEDEVLRRKSR